MVIPAVWSMPPTTEPAVFPVASTTPGRFGGGVGSAVFGCVATCSVRTVGIEGSAAAGSDAFAGASAEPPTSALSSVAGAFGRYPPADGVLRPAAAIRLGHRSAAAISTLAGRDTRTFGIRRGDERSATRHGPALPCAGRPSQKPWPQPTPS